MNMILVAAILFLFASCSRAADPAAAVAWMQKTVPGAIKTFRNKFDGDFSTETLSVTVTKPKSINQQSQSRYMKTGNLILQSVEIQGTPATSGQQFVRGANERYYFLLDRNKRGATWLLTKLLTAVNVADAPQDHPQVGLHKSVINAPASLIRVPTFSGFKSPEELPDLPNFRILSADASPVNPSVLTVDFQYDWVRPGQVTTLSNCHIEFDMAMYGLPKFFNEVASTSGGKRTTSITNERKNPPDGDTFGWHSRV